MKQILLNLQSNALKFTKRGGSVSIRVTYLQQPSTLDIQVVDTGCGIREQDQAKLFKLYGFLSATEEVNPKGIGLGLYICKKLANKLGGDVTATSVWGEGSNFNLSVPIKEIKQPQS